MKQLKLFFLFIIIASASFGQVKISALAPVTGSTPSIDSMMFAVVQNGVTKRMYGYQLKNSTLFGSIKNISPGYRIIIDSLGPDNYSIRWDSAGFVGSGEGITALTGDVTATGTGSVSTTLATVNSNVGSYNNANITVNAKGLITAVSNGYGATSYKMSSSAPTDTTVGWIDLRYNFYDASPVHFWVNGAWSHTDTTGGQFWDNVGMVFSRGRPYIIIATGQSNLGGPYIGEASNPNASPYNGYYGDTIPCRAVAAWDYNRNIWVVAKIRDTPFQYSSGANYLLIAAKKINEQTGRSVRIVTYPQGGTGLQCWLPDSACYNEFKSRVQNSGVTHPDLFIWAQSEAGITPVPTFDTYSNRWIGMKDTMILDGLMDSTTLKILMASGDTLTNGNVIQMQNGTSAGEGALRALAATNDPTIKYVPLFKYQIQLTDGLHILPKGHEITGEALFHSAMEGPKVAGRDMMGYGAPSPYKWSSNEQRLGMGGLVAINSNNKSYFGLGVEGNDTYYTAAEPNLLGQYASGLRFSQALNTARFSHYNNTSWLQLEDARGLFNVPTATKQTATVFGVDPEYKLLDLNNNKEWRLQMVNGSNELHFVYDNVPKFHFIKTGELAIGVNTPHPSALVDLTSTTKGFLPPRMTAAEGEAIASPAQGLMIYITSASGAIFTQKGWWGYDGSDWVLIR